MKEIRHKKEHTSTRKRRVENNQIAEQYLYSGMHSEVTTQFLLISYDKESMNELQSDSYEEILLAMQPSKTNWLIVKGLTNAEAISHIGQNVGLGRLEIQDILNPNHPAKIESSPNHILIVLNECYQEEEVLKQEHFTLLMKQDLLITFQETELHLFKNVKEAINENKAQIREKNSDYLLSVLLNNTIGNYITLLLQLEDTLGELEDTLLEQTEDKNIRVQIQKKRKEYRMIKQTVGILNEEYNQLFIPDNTLIRTQTKSAYSDVKDHLKYASQLLESCRETLSSLSDLYVSNNDLRMNRIMQRLTVVATIFIPLTFLAGVWGMNFKVMPELSWSYGYPLAWGIMIITGLFLWLFFARRKWF
ncbi:MAG: magnesium/cobalt transporter CorA [Bacteroidales bacterium]|nr:magnesium/cobalt transporter CorA [Bacteroidales bacterium]MDD4822082.1 magnesium/cobalt transporter CorA [Bacteroidales bacterium]